MVLRRDCRTQADPEEHVNADDVLMQPMMRFDLQASQAP